MEDQQMNYYAVTVETSAHNGAVGIVFRAPSRESAIQQATEWNRNRTEEDVDYLRFFGWTADDMSTTRQIIPIEERIDDTGTYSVRVRAEYWEDYDDYEIRSPDDPIEDDCREIWIRVSTFFSECSEQAVIVVRVAPEEPEREESEDTSEQEEPSQSEETEGSGQETRGSSARL